MRHLRFTFLGAFILGAFGANLSAAEVFDPRPWLEDLDQARSAFTTKYADLEWEVFARGLDISAIFRQTRERVQQAGGVDDAKAAFNDLAKQFGDKHVGFRWPESHTSLRERAGLDCANLGYSKQMQAEPLATLVPGFIPLSPLPSKEFPAGILRVGGHKLGVVKIRLFSPRAFPDLCEEAISALQIDRARICDDSCRDGVDLWSSVAMTQNLEATLAAVKAAGAEYLLVDVAGNGGGSQWAEAAARMLTTARLKSTPMYFMKGEHWTKKLAKSEGELRRAAISAHDEDREFLSTLADSVATHKKEAEKLCDGEALWSGKHPACVWLGDGFYSTGILQSADSDKLRSKPWAKFVFTPMQYPYREGIWRGPLLILVDGGTGSAAEQFAAELQDNRAAVIIGSLTIGAGCGHTDGGTPTTLKNTGAILELPDCVRMRPGGLNLASGVQPDILVGLQGEDSPRRRASLLSTKLGEAVKLAGKPTH